MMKWAGFAGIGLLASFMMAQALFGAPGEQSFPVSKKQFERYSYSVHQQFSTLAKRVPPMQNLSGYARKTALSNLSASVAGKQDYLGYVPVNTNDARLSDARVPIAHASTHFTAGSDSLSPSDIGASPTGHGHVFGNISGLQGALDGKQPVGDYATSGQMTNESTARRAHELLTYAHTGAKDKSGTTDRVQSFLTFSSSTRKFRIAAVSGNFETWNNGTSYLTPLQEVVLTNTAGMHYVYMNQGTLYDSTTPWDITGTAAPIATVYWTGTAGAAGDERHSANRDRTLHRMLHSTVGARYANGLTCTFATASVSCTSGAIYDEDILHSMTAQTALRVWWKNHTTSSTFADNVTAPMYAVGGVLKFNNNTTLTSVSNAYHVANYLYATNDINYPLAMIVGQAQYSNIADARNDLQPSLAGLTTQEWRLIYRMIARNVGGTPTYVEATDYRTSSSLPGGVVSSLPASQVTYTPTSPDTATNVQAALDGRAQLRRQATFWNVSAQNISATQGVTAYSTNTLPAVSAISTTEATGVYAQSATGYGIYSITSGVGNAVVGTAMGAAHGVYGYSGAVNKYGGYFNSLKSTGIGVFNNISAARYFGDGSALTAITPPQVFGNPTSGSVPVFTGSNNWQWQQPADVCGATGIGIPVYDGAPGRDALYCNVYGGTQTIVYDAAGSNPYPVMSAFAVHLYEGANEVTPLYWSWSTGGASNRVYGSGTAATFTPDVKPIFNNYSNNNYVSGFFTYSSAYGKRGVRCGLPISVSKAGEQGFRGYSGLGGQMAVGTVTTLVAGSNATVTNVGTPSSAVWNFGIPKGADGDPGDITQAQIEAKIAEAGGKLYKRAVSSDSEVLIEVARLAGDTSVFVTAAGLVVVQNAAGTRLLSFDPDTSSVTVKKDFFVAVGSGTNSIATSTDGINWTGGGTSIFSTAGYSVAWNGSMWVAVGSGTNSIATSTDGINWTGRGTSIFSTAGYGVAWNGSMWVAGGYGTNSIATSTDGINWTGRGTSVFSTYGYGIAWNGSMWVASGYGTNSIATSTDGINWTGRGTSVFSTYGRGVAWNGSMWVAVGGGTNSIATSTDGINWTGGGTSIFSTAGYGVAWNGSMWVAVGNGTNSIATSTDGINWTGRGLTIFTSRGTGVASIAAPNLVPIIAQPKSILAPGKLTL